MINTTGMSVSTRTSECGNVVLPSCPQWCTEPAGHPFDEMGRLHIARRGHVTLSSFESLDGTREPAGIDVDYEAERLSADAAHKLAKDADTLAELLQRAA